MVNYYHVSRTYELRQIKQNKSEKKEKHKVVPIKDDYLDVQKGRTIR